MKIFIVQGDHFSDPGRPMTAHATKASADIEAASLVNIMLADSVLNRAKATPENWERAIAKLRKRYDDECDVWITELELVA